MNIKSISLIIVVLSIVIYFMLSGEDKQGIDDELSNKNDDITVPVKSSDTNDTAEIDLNGYEVITTQVPSEIHFFNSFVEENIDHLGHSISKDTLDEFIESINESNVDAIAAELKNFVHNPAENLTSIRELEVYCSALRTRENNNFPEDMSTSPKAEMFLLALQKSELCSNYLTENDPFYIALDLARKGNKLAQLFLVEDLGHAMQRGLVNPQLHPLEYNDLKNEAIDYLKVLSAQGVVQATINLKNIYKSSAFLVPRDDVLHYYYAFLAEKQSNNRNLFFRNSDQLYDQLSDKEQSKADRMTRNVR
jgi:hypothetical protein